MVMKFSENPIMGLGISLNNILEQSELAVWLEEIRSEEYDASAEAVSAIESPYEQDSEYSAWLSAVSEDGDWAPSAIATSANSFQYQGFSGVVKASVTPDVSYETYTFEVDIASQHNNPFNTGSHIGDGFTPQNAGEFGSGAANGRGGTKGRPQDPVDEDTVDPIVFPKFPTDVPTTTTLANVVDTYTSGLADTASDDYFNIDLYFIGDDWDLPDMIGLQQAFIDAAEYLSSIILSGVEDMDISGISLPGDYLDDIRIDAELDFIDGVGGILGQAGPGWYRINSDVGEDYIPLSANMTFDSADALTYYDNGLWDEIVMHEMLHSIGFGSMWGSDYMDLISGNRKRPYFDGENAKLAYDTLYPELGGPGPRVEDGGGAGTARSHWDEATFDAELMTGYIEATDTDMYLSPLTIAALEDMGYDTVWDSSDPGMGLA